MHTKYSSTFQFSLAIGTENFMDKSNYSSLLVINPTVRSYIATYICTYVCITVYIKASYIMYIGWDIIVVTFNCSH